MMEGFPKTKVFFVLLEGNEKIRPFAVTLYEDYCHEDIYATIMDELCRQSESSIELFSDSHIMVIEGSVVKPHEFMYEMFEAGAIYPISIRDYEDDDQ